MKRNLTIAALALAATTSFSAPAHAGVNLNIDVGVPVVVAPPPPQIVLRAAPRFIFSPFLGMYVSVGIPYDIVYFGNDYYLYQGGYWYRGPYYNGPWARVGYRRLPPLLRRHRFEEIRRYRDDEFHRYEMDRGHYRGRWHEPRFREGEFRGHRERR
ncbi:MAG TPA: hypothetical protein VF795_01975 [Desulfuromonadaceae bacterium]